MYLYYMKNKLNFPNFLFKICSEFFLLFDLRLLVSLQWCFLYGEIRGVKSQFFRCIRLRVVSRILSAFYFVKFLFRQDFCYDHMTSQSLQIYCFFYHSCHFNWNAYATSFSRWVKRVFCSFAWLTFWSRVTYLPHSQKWLPDSETDFSLF